MPIVPSTGGGGEDKPKRRIKVRRNEEANVAELTKAGYTLRKDKGGRQVWERTTESSSSTPTASQSESEWRPNMLGGKFNIVAEKTGPKMKFMPDKFPGGGGSGVGQTESRQKQTQKIIFKTKKPKEQGEGFIEKIKARMQSNAANREMRRADRRFGQGCKTPNRVSRARY